MKKYFCEMNFNEPITVDNEQIKNYGVVGFTNEKSYEFQQDIDDSLKQYNLTRDGARNGSIYNSLQKEIGSYQVFTKDIN